MDSTSESLISQLRRPGNDVAWNQFVSIYSQPLYNWLTKKSLQPHDALDIVQQVFVVLVRRLPEFQYDQAGSFRSWLFGITTNIWKNHVRQANRSIGLESDLDNYQSVDRDHDDMYFQKDVFQSALAVIRPEFHAETWQAFELHGLQGKPAKDVAAELGTTIGAVYASRHRVVTRIRQLLWQMDDSLSS
ncbi:MAG: sigma-70 family RNA polymerase sigma factor [Gemmataceae bacterium]